MQTKKADEMHMQLCAKIEKAVINAAMDSHNELLVQLPSEIQHPRFASIRLESYADDIGRLQSALETAGYVIDNAAYKNSFMIKW